MKKFISLLILIAGCANYSALDSCPEHFRANIGQIHTEPLNPLGLFFKGMVSPRDPNGTIYLYFLADNDTLLEEAFHSFEIRAGHNQNGEWESFYADFNPNGLVYKGYGGPLVAISLLTIPFPQLVPGGKGYINLYSRVNHFEDSAACFVELMHEHTFANDEVLSNKIEAVRRFVNGEYK